MRLAPLGLAFLGFSLACAGDPKCGDGTEEEDGECVAEEEDLFDDDDTDSGDSGVDDTDTGGDTDTAEDTDTGGDSAQDTDADDDGYAAADDCDDADATVNPGATEICGDGVDQDCDGGAVDCRLSDGTLSRTTADVTFYGEVADEYAGASADFAGDLDGDGLDEVLIGAPNEPTAGAWGGAVYVMAGGASGAIGLGDAHAKLTSPDAGANLGYGATAAGDLDGDGAADFVVGGYTYANYTGELFLVYGPVPAGTRAIDDVPGVGRVVGEGQAQCGLVAAGGADVSGDGRDDVVFGCFSDSTTGEETGAAYVVTSASSGTTSTSDYIALRGASAGDHAGASVAIAPDVDGDGLGDVLVGATVANAAYVVLGPFRADLDLAAADGVLTQAGGNFGNTVAGVGDMDGDGYGDFAVGDKESTRGGQQVSTLYLYDGAVGGVDGASEIRLSGTPGSSAGYEANAVEGLGDVDGDGFADLVAGGIWADDGGTNSGEVTVVFGPVLGDDDLASYPRLDGTIEGAGVGGRVGGGGDYDGDGIPDLLASGNTGLGASNGGGAFLVLGTGM